MTRLNTLTRVASLAVAQYLRHCPLERGKYRLRAFAGSHFLHSPTPIGQWLRVSGISEFEWKLLYGFEKEPRTLNTILRLLEPGMTVVDAGANIGYYSLAAASRVGTTGRVHAFEPSPSVAARLAENVQINALETCIQVNASALGRQSGEARLYLDSDDCEGNSMFSAVTARVSIRIQVDTLDEYICRNGITRVDLLKVDVEGAESALVVGAQGVLSGSFAPVIIMEFNPAALSLAGTSARSLQMLLTTFGYECFVLEQLTKGDSAVYNILALKSFHWQKYRIPAKDTLTHFNAPLC